MSGEETFQSELEPSETAVSEEEIAFFKDEITRVEKTEKGHDFSIGKRAIAEANFFSKIPELGMQEEKSVRFLAKRLAKI